MRHFGIYCLKALSCLIMAASVLNSDRAVEMPHCAGNWLLWNYRNATLCRSALNQRLSTG
jgi:hypothetical protein